MQLPLRVDSRQPFLMWNAPDNLDCAAGQYLAEKSVR